MTMCTTVFVTIQQLVKQTDRQTEIPYKYRSSVSLCVSMLTCDKNGLHVGLRNLIVLH